MLIRLRNRPRLIRRPRARKMQCPERMIATLPTQTRQQQSERTRQSVKLQHGHPQKAEIMMNRPFQDHLCVTKRQSKDLKQLVTKSRILNSHQHKRRPQLLLQKNRISLLRRLLMRRRVHSFLQRRSHSSSSPLRRNLCRLRTTRLKRLLRSPTVS